MTRFRLAICLLVMLSSAVLAASDEPEPDPRLDEKVTITTVGKALGDFCREITAQTGVKFSARKDAADIKVAVFLKDVPLSSLRDALKDCLHLQCTREGKKDEWTYSFWEDMKTRQEAGNIRREQVKKLRTYVEMLGRQMAEMEAEGKDPAALYKPFGELTGEQKEKLKNENPDRYKAYLRFQHPGPLAALAAYSALSRAQLQALWAGHEVNVFADEMSPALKERFLSRAYDWMELIWQTSYALRRGDADPPPPPDCIILSVRDSDWDNRPVLFYGFGVARAGEQKSVVVSGSSQISMPEEATDDEPTPNDAEGDSRPDLKLEIAPESTAYDVMEQVFELTGVSIVSDYYTRVKQPGVIRHILTGEHPAFKTADDVLRQVAKDVKSDLDASGDIRTLGSRSWPSDREREIPERLLARWRAARKKYGGARIEEALEMANLSRLQLEDLELYKTGYGWAIIPHRDAIRVAGSLTSGQWQAAMSETGLPTSGMSASQLALIQAWARETEEYRTTARLTEELRDPVNLRSCLLRIVYNGNGEKDDSIKAQWAFELHPPSYYEALWKAMSEAASQGEESLPVPSPQCCRGHVRLADLNNPRAWPADDESPSD